VIASADQETPMKTRGMLLFFLLAAAPVLASAQSASEIEKLVAKLDTEYQAAVKANDAATMDRILGDDMVLITGRGKVFTKADLLKDARGKTTTYDKQDELEQKVRVFGENTAVVTALLWIRGTTDGQTSDRKLWFSDTYVKTARGWRYVLGQASIALPDNPQP
jgi:ketosteroid isomerase-like protein